MICGTTLKACLVVVICGTTLGGGYRTNNYSTVLKESTFWALLCNILGSIIAVYLLFYGIPITDLSLPNLTSSKLIGNEDDFKKGQIWEVFCLYL